MFIGKIFRSIAALGIDLLAVGVVLFAVGLTTQRIRSATPEVTHPSTAVRENPIRCLFHRVFEIKQKAGR